MAYLGNTPTTQSFISGTDYFNGTGSQTAFTLSRTVNSINDIQAVVNNVVQQPNDAYTLSGTTITFTSAPSSGTNNVYVRYLSTTTQVITPSQNSVGTAQLAPLTTIPVVGGYTATLPSSSGTILTTTSPKAGNVIQVVSAVMTGGIFSTTSTSFVDVGFSATITPTFASSRILILFNSGGITRPAVASESLRLKIVRGASTAVYGGDNLIFSTSATQFQDFPSSYQCVDSPGVTTATTYKIQMETRLGNSCSMNGGATNNPATLQLLEIAS